MAKPADGLMPFSSHVLALFSKYIKLGIFQKNTYSMTLPKNSVDFHQSQGTSYFSMRLRHYQNKKEKKILKIQIL